MNGETKIGLGGGGRDTFDLWEREREEGRVYMFHSLMLVVAEGFLVDIFPEKKCVS